MADFKLGDRVRYTNGLRRRYVERPGGGWRKEWQPLSFDSPHPEHRGEGIVIGLRTLADGRVQYNGYDEPPTFHADARFTAVLVAHSLRSKPVYVRVEDVEPVSESPISETEER